MTPETPLHLLHSACTLFCKTSLEELCQDHIPNPGPLLTALLCSLYGLTDYNLRDFSQSVHPPHRASSLCFKHWGVQRQMYHFDVGSASRFEVRNNKHKRFYWLSSFTSSCCSVQPVCIFSPGDIWAAESGGSQAGRGSEERRGW